MTKRFGRPAPTFDAPKAGPVRQINLPREGHILEGVYAAASARSDMATAPYDAMRRDNFKRSFVLWFIAALFWLGLAYAFPGGASKAPGDDQSAHQVSTSNPE